MKHLLFFLLIIAFCSSCGTGKINSIYYSPSNITSVGLDEKNDLKVKANITQPKMRRHVDSGEPQELSELHLAWSPLKHLGLYANSHRYRESFFQSLADYDVVSTPYISFPTVSFDNSRHQFDLRMKEFGIGYYNKFHPNIAFEIYGYHGFGKGEHRSGGHKFDYKISKTGIRGSLTAHFGISNFGASLAMSKLKFHHFKNSYDQELKGRSNYLMRRPDQNMMQFATFYKLNFKFLEIHSEIGTNQSIKHQNFLQNNHYLSVGAGIDIQYIISRLKK